MKPDSLLTTLLIIGIASILMMPSEVSAPPGTIDGTNGDDTCTTLTATVTDPNVNGKGGNDDICGDEFDNKLKGGSGDDHITGGAGNDNIDGGPGNDYLLGEAGDDKLVGGVGAGVDRIFGGDGDDELVGGNGADELDGEDGEDILFGGNGPDLLVGGEDNDILNGGNGPDVLDGGDGDDILDGESGNDILFGDEGDDTLFGGIGDNFLDGGDGTDTCFVDEIADTLDVADTFTNCENVININTGAVILGSAPPTPSDVDLSDIIIAVEDLRDSGDLADRDADKLVTLLEEAEVEFGGNVGKACGKLDKFISNVNQLINKGKIPTLDGENLIADVDAVKANNC